MIAIGCLLGGLLTLADVSPPARAQGQDPSSKPAEDVRTQDPTPSSPPPAAEGSPGPTPKPVGDGVAPTPARSLPVLDFTKPFDHAAYEAALGGIAEAYPDLLRVQSLGLSRGGRDLWLAVLADAAAEEPRRHPGAVVVTDLARAPDGQVAGPEAALYVLEGLLARARTDPQFRERFRRSALYFLPAPDPDHAFPASSATPAAGGTETGSEVARSDPPAPGAAHRAVQVEENFPARWLPFGPGVIAPGPYALSEPESSIVARFLLERENLSTIVVLARADPVPSGPGTDGSAAPRAAAPGGLRAYAGEILDLAVREARPWTGEPRSTVFGTAPAGFETAVALALSVLDGLPRLECGPPKIERLRPDLWLLDLQLENAGSLPTLGGDSRRAEVPGVSLQVGGGRVIACALRDPRSESYRALHEPLAIVPMGHLDGGETLGVRIVVQAEEGAALAVAFRSSRAGTASLDAALR